MTNEQKYEEIKALKIKLDKINDEYKRQPGNIKLRIKRDKVRLEIKDIKNILTDEDFQDLMKASEIDTGKC